MQDFDLVIVGSGSGLDVASVAARQGLDVAVVEDGPLGGTCLNRGCVPSKMLVHRADVKRGIDTADEFGIDATVEDVDFSGMVHEVADHVERDSEAIRRGVEASENHTLFDDTGRFVDERTIAVGDETLRGEKVVVAAGTRPAIPDVEGIEDVDYWTSTEALRADEPPERLVIVGGGYVAAELAHYFGTFGSDVTIVGRRGALLPGEDPAVARHFTEQYEHRFDVRTGYEASAVRESGGEIELDAEAVDGDDTVRVRGDRVLVAAGRVPNTDRLDVAAGGIETTDEGYVATNRYLETSAENVWALGDVVGRYPYKHAANHEASAVITNALRDEREAVDYTAMPHAVFADPQVAAVGYTEAELRAESRDYRVGGYEYADTAMGAAMGDPPGFVKVLVAPDGEILGTHVVGPHASQLVHEVCVAMRAGSGTVADIRDTIHVHPALNEVVARAFGGRFSDPDERR
ncbi:dihydrolipoamide dehydrogenase [Halarchaeum rubridurum]|uniref:Dihydrolipoamide dehydrogenase n=1 Tax=Halarchaeum rubridurum TaxID=489911 RepID=A0A830FPR8_9EURY|nr:dihydrolipoyl dehydrogenase [Halarchaeum rubridurum]MBP1953186.1 dihydrolipoamide dehydrogenase [Halarchaeum rubridurum]GGM67176.1 dihydrolipoyl dehydrogenase [Halarchaeum rubridurum]